MAITISNLSGKKNGNNYTFADLHLDLQAKQVSNNKQNNKIYSGNDIVIDTDEKAIENSVINLLFQRRYLNPTANLQLRKYLGQPATMGLARDMGNTINETLEQLEPRIQIQKVLVSPNVDTFSYQIAIIYNLVNFPNRANVVRGVLNNNGVFSSINLNNS